MSNGLQQTSSKELLGGQVPTLSLLFCRLMSFHLSLLVGLLFLLVPPVCPSVTAQHSAPSSSIIQDALQPQFTPPAPGTYTLPPIDTVTDHSLLNTEGQQIKLFSLTQGKVSVISFMYTACSDVAGCPLAAAVLQQLDRLLNTRPEIAKQVQLLSVSFDPERDTPQHLATVRTTLAPQTDWQFLTVATPGELQPILTDFNQSVAKLWDINGEWSGLFRHVLKVYLLDQQHNVRNIYSAGFLNAQLVLNDIETILLETSQHSIASPTP
ncbi:MAG: SCO family protein [Candidatus Binatia bacterium]